MRTAFSKTFINAVAMLSLTGSLYAQWVQQTFLSTENLYKVRFVNNHVCSVLGGGLTLLLLLFLLACDCSLLRLLPLLGCSTDNWRCRVGGGDNNRCQRHSAQQRLQ
ncbi:hypothetical protein DWB58_30360 [candidate division KSB1 bacterium]|nr:hypothetical protein [candidate division KSB1 bacterium]